MIYVSSEIWSKQSHMISFVRTSQVRQSSRVKRRRQRLLQRLLQCLFQRLLQCLLQRQHQRPQLCAVCLLLMKVTLLLFPRQSNVKEPMTTIARRPSKRPGKFSRRLNRRVGVMLEQLRGSEMLTDEHMDHAQGERRDRFPFINGWQAMSVVTAHRAANVGTPDSPWVQVTNVCTFQRGSTVYLHKQSTASLELSNSMTHYVSPFIDHHRD